MQLEILTPDKTLYSGNTTAVTFPGTDGEFQILKDHAAMVASLKAGNIKIVTKEGQEQVVIQGGVVEVLDNKIIVLA